MSENTLKGNDYDQLVQFLNFYSSYTPPNMPGYTEKVRTQNQQIISLTKTRAAALKNFILEKESGAESPSLSVDELKTAIGQVLEKHPSTISGIRPDDLDNVFKMTCTEAFRLLSECKTPVRVHACAKKIAEDTFTFNRNLPPEKLKRSLVYFMMIRLDQAQSDIQPPPILAQVEKQVVGLLLKKVLSIYQIGGVVMASNIPPETQAMRDIAAIAADYGFNPTLVKKLEQIRTQNPVDLN